MSVRQKTLKSTESATGGSSSRFLPRREPVAMSRKCRAVGPGGPQVVSAITGTNAELMENVARLWIKEGDVIADVTYGRGAFWKRLPEPHTKHDLALDGVDCRNLPYSENTFDCVVIDPPYRPGHGSKNFSENGMAKAYQLGSLDTINDVLGFYRAAIVEARRVLTPGGRLMVKCQDLSYANRLHLVTLDVLRDILENGFDLADQFLLVNTPNLSSSAWKRQERARRSHSVLWVACKTNAKGKRRGEAGGDAQEYNKT